VSFRARQTRPRKPQLANVSHAQSPPNMHPASIARIDAAARYLHS